MAESVIDIRGNLPTTGGGAVVQTDLGVLVASFIGAAILIGGIAAFGYMMLGAVQWITAGGDKGKVEKAREKIIQSIVGLALVVSTFAIFMVVQYFFGINITQLGAGTGGASSAKSGSSSSSSSEICTVGQTYNDGGAGGYCSDGGAARLICVGAGQGSSQFSYAHFEPCACVTGEPLSGYQFSTCSSRTGEGLFGLF